MIFLFQDEVLALLKSAMLKKVGETKCFLIDGYPRELEQGKRFEAEVISLGLEWGWGVGGRGGENPLRGKSLTTVFGTLFCSVQQQTIMCPLYTETASPFPTLNSGLVDMSDTAMTY